MFTSKLIMIFYNEMYNYTLHVHDLFKDTSFLCIASRSQQYVEAALFLYYVTLLLIKLKISNSNGLAEMNYNSSSF